MTIVPITASPVSALPSLPDLPDIGSVPGTGAGAAQPTQPADGIQSFGQLISDEVNKVEQSQQAASSAQAALASGQTTDVAAVALETDKAAITLDLATTIRNKVLDAYQSISSMNV